MIDRELERNCPDPESTRREDSPGVPVTLSDGRVWYLASPRLLLSPKVVTEEDHSRIGLKKESIEIEAFVGYPCRMADPLSRLNEAVDSEKGSVPHKVVFEAAVQLLLGCHDLTLSQAAGLLVCDSVGLVSIIDALGRAVRSEGVDP